MGGPHYVQREGYVIGQAFCNRRNDVRAARPARNIVRRPAACLLVWLFASGPVLFQARGQEALPRLYDNSAGPVGDVAFGGVVATAFDAAASSSCQNCRGSGCDICCAGAAKCGGHAGMYGGADFLLVRPHFSEAIAFARGSQALTFLSTQGEELQFGYDGSLRAFWGYRSEQGAEDLRFTYWNLSGETAVAGAAAGPGQFIVDPFGNIVGSVTIIDPADFRVGNTLVGGDFIRTRATVDVNVYDLDLAVPVALNNPNQVFQWSVGARIADVDQYYESVVTTGGALLARGDFSVDFIGAGPSLGFESHRFFGDQQSTSVFAKGHGSLLVGEYDVRSNNSPVPGFTGSQHESLTRLTPVVEIELGATRQVGDWLNLSAGWIFQAWFDFGTSGGQFGGFFSGADDSNIMSFDGLTVRAEVLF